MIVAIDPGLSGGLVLAGCTGVILATAMPATDADILSTLAPLSGDAELVAYLENIVYFAGKNMPSSSGIKYGANWGFLKGVLMTYGYRLVLVPPQKWQKALGLGTSRGMTKTAWKNKLKNLAGQLNPNLRVTLATADALLIYECAKRGHLG